MHPLPFDQDWCENWERTTRKLMSAMQQADPDIENVVQLVQLRAKLLKAAQKGVFKSEPLPLNERRERLEKITEWEKEVSLCLDGLKGDLGKFLASFKAGSKVRNAFLQPTGKSTKILDGRI